MHHHRASRLYARRVPGTGFVRRYREIHDEEVSFWLQLARSYPCYYIEMVRERMGVDPTLSGNGVWAASVVSIGQRQE